jgi:hypothetical protein
MSHLAIGAGVVHWYGKADSPLHPTGTTDGKALLSLTTFMDRYDIYDGDEAVSRTYADGIDDRNYFSVRRFTFAL